MHQFSSLKRLLTYKNPEIVARFRKTYGLSRRETDVIFKDMLRYLWLGFRNRELRDRDPEGADKLPVSVGMLEAFVIVDEMWHTFVLHSVEYESFCKRYFGQFIHHIPEPAISKSRTTRQHEPVSVEAIFELVWRELGPETARRWFYHYPRRFTKKAIRRLQYKAAA